MVTWVIFLTIGLVIGIAAGMFIGQLDDIKRKQREELQNKLDSTRQELADYKHKVTEHFVQTSALVNNMTESYKAIHDHLSVGAGTLCDSPLDVNKLNISEVNVIEKQPATEEQMLKAASTKAQDDAQADADAPDENASADVSVEAKDDPNDVDGDDKERQQTAEQVLTEKVKGAGFGGVDLGEPESITVNDEKIDDKSEPSQAADSLASEKKEKISVFPSVATQTDVEQKEAAANRIMH